MLEEILRNGPIWAAVTAWAIAQGCKIILTLLTEQRLDMSRAYTAGGMPSSHTALVCAMAFAVGKRYGFDAPSFAVSLIVSFIVMYDAAGVRRAAGEHAAAINILLSQSGMKLEEQLKELLGHTPLQVFCGAVLGIAVGLIF